MAKQKASLSKYIHAIRASPREIFNRRLFLAVGAFALGGCAKGWDEGSASAISQLPSFKAKYNLDDGIISNVVSLVNIGAAAGALLSFLLNDRIGRIWSMRVYQLCYIIGCLISCFSSGNLAALYVGRIVAGLGIGALSVICPMAIAEIAPSTTRGLMTLWFSVCMLSGQTLGIFTVFGCLIHVPATKDLQYQIPWFVQTFVPAISIGLSFFIIESPRWLLMDNKHAQSLSALAHVRGLPQDHTYLREEYNGMASQVENRDSGLAHVSSIQIIKETLTIPSNLRRVQLTLIAYILAQISGANVITNYLPTILGMIGLKGSSVKLYSTGFYSLDKLVFCIAASLVLVDVIGRRKSLLIGISIQIVCYSYLAGYLNFYLKDPEAVDKGASNAAIAIIYIHAIGWAIGLYSLPYLFGAELWPNRIRSFGGALSQTFHWLFYFAITKATTSMLQSLHQWGTFVLFVGFCSVALAYTYFVIPETSGLTLEQINKIFERPWYRLREPLPEADEELEDTHPEPQADKKDDVWIEHA